MKKAKTLAIILVVAMMLMGAGYAVWTDSVTITGDVSTGELDVLIVDAKETELVNANSSVINGITENGSKEIIINVNELSGEGSAKFEIKLENKGTIDAVVTDLKINAQDDLTVTANILEGNPVIGSEDRHTFELEIKLNSGAEQGQEGLTFTVTPEFTQHFGNTN